MLNIAICDDDIMFCTHLENILLNISRKTGIELETEVFYTGESLYNALSTQGYIFDLILLDIELLMMNGVQVGQKIREELNNDIVQILYISGKESYAMALFDIRPLNFLIKPVDPEKVEEQIKKAFEITTKNNAFFEYKIGQTQRKIPIKDIIFFESSGKKIRIILSSASIEFYGKLTEIEEQLNSCDFIPIHKSYLINYLHVIEYQYEQVKMSNNVCLPVSQAYRKSVRDRLLQRRREER